MKSGILLLAAFLLCHSILGQEISKEDILKYRIISITYIDSPGTGKRVDVYNDYGDIIRKTLSSDDSSTDSNTEYVYNDSFQLIRSVNFLNGSKDHSSAYFYTNKLLSRVETLNAANALTIYTIEYDKRGYKTKDAYSGIITRNYRTTKYTYNEQNLLASETTTDRISKKKTETTYTYNSNGQLIKTKQELTPSLIFTTAQEYNDSGQPAEQTISVSNGDVFRYTYTYDHKGLPTGSIMQGTAFIDGKKTTLQHKTTIVINT